jgi:hypothetical protein
MPLAGGPFGALSRETLPPHPAGCGVGASPPKGGLKWTFVSIGPSAASTIGTTK